MTPQAFESIISDTGKRLADTPVWCDDEDHSPANEFRSPIRSRKEG